MSKATCSLCDNFTADQKADLEWTFPVSADDQLPWLGVEHKTLEDEKMLVSPPCNYCLVMQL